MPRHGFIAGTAPRPCATCRTMFTPDGVGTVRRRNGGDRYTLCPRCYKDAKRTKKQK